MNQVYFTHGNQKRRGVIRYCAYCAKEFVARDGTGRWANARYCSRECGYNGRRAQLVPLTCATCSVSFLRPKGKLQSARHKTYFCSRKCKDEGQRIGGVKAIQPPHYGNGEKNYRDQFTRAGGVLKCVRCGYDEFEAGIDVHHKDEDKTNNFIENLTPLCANCHRGLHAGKWQL